MMNLQQFGACLLVSVAAVGSTSMPQESASGVQEGPTGVQDGATEPVDDAAGEQEAANAVPDTSPPTIEEVEALLLGLEQSTAESKEALAETYQQTLLALGRASDARTRARLLTRDAEESPALIAALSRELSAPPAEPDMVLDPELTLQALEVMLEDAQAELTVYKERVAELEFLAEYRTSRKAELPEAIATTEQSLRKAQDALAASSLNPEAEARTGLILAQIEEFRAALSSLETERSTYAARRELLPLRRDRALRRVAEAEATTSFLSDRVDRWRALEGEAAVVAAQEQLQEIMRRFPALEGIAVENSALAALRSGEEGLPKRISRAQADLESTRELLEKTKQRFRSAQRRISAGGLSEDMALILRHDFEQLPKERALRGESDELGALLAAAQLELISIEEERALTGDLSVAQGDLIEELDLDAPSDELVAMVRDLLVVRRQGRDSALDYLATLTTSFYDHKDIARELLTVVQDYRGFIERRILWVRSSSLNPLDSFVALPAHVRQIAEALSSSSGLVGAGSRALRSRQCVLMGLALLVLVLLRRYLKRKRLELAAQVRSFRSDHYLLTIRALFQSLLLALPLPLVCWSLGQLLSASTGESARAVGGALREVSTPWLVLRFLREILVDQGVGQTHFKWSASSTEAVRRELRWFGPVVVPLGVGFLALDRQSVTPWSDSIGRLCFVLAMACLALFSHRVLRVGSGLWSSAPRAGKGLLVKTHRLWSLVATGLPCGLAVVALMGYYYTAIQFEQRLRGSVGFALALVLANALLLRWLFMARRRLAVSQALDARARREDDAAAETSESSSQPLDADKVDIPAADAQTRQLFKSGITVAAFVGLYLIWASVLPALQGLDRVQLLPVLSVLAAEGEEARDDLISSVAATSDLSESTAPVPIGIPGMPSTTPIEGSEAGLGLPSRLTLADLLLALIFFLLTAVAAKNVPALLELSVLQRLPLDGGARYAVTTIVRYVILIVGVSAGSGALGVGWQQIQWLAAALTFGLAFGLQEIFANFVSGLIILIERPIRVGDIVTVGGTEGRVTQLRMRATTIQDWERRELLVPNKEFITGSIINWTLSDPVTRYVLAVGVAYGSDTAAARRLVLEAAKGNHSVLIDPAPNVVFRSFGESSLDLELRFFLPNRDLWPEVIDDLHCRVDESFRRAGIEIAFPQRDIHIRSKEGLELP
ncbi:MAG: potassium efflux system protein [Gammaproteobacteria bacterium]|jgi:potassium efflux system protein